MKPAWLILLACAAQGRVLTVGPGHEFAYPCDAFAAAATGDEVDIDAAGTYGPAYSPHWVCTIRVDGLYIKGVNGRPHIQTDGQVSQGVGVWAVAANDVTIENVEISGGRENPEASGIRFQGKNLTLFGVYLHDNSDGLLTNGNGIGTIVILRSEFANNGAGDGFSHNLYINYADAVLFAFNYSHDANTGHLFKSRARANYVLFNRFDDGSAPAGASYQVDLPNGGSAYIEGNVFEKRANAQNGAVISYREETGSASQSCCVWPNDYLYVLYNDFAVSYPGPVRMVSIDPGTDFPATIEDNIFLWRQLGFGGNVTNQAGAKVAANLLNADPGFADPSASDYRISDGSAAAGAAVDPGVSVEGGPLAPGAQGWLDCAQPRVSSVDAGAMARGAAPCQR